MMIVTPGREVSMNLLHLWSIPRNRTMPRSATRGRGLLCFRTTACFLLWLSVIFFIQKTINESMMCHMPRNEISWHDQFSCKSTALVLALPSKDLDVQHTHCGRWLCMCHVRPCTYYLVTLLTALTSRNHQRSSNCSVSDFDVFNAFPGISSETMLLTLPSSFGFSIDVKCIFALCSTSCCHV